MNDFDYQIYRFNKTNYSNIDSITFAVAAKVGGCQNGGDGYVSLYNITDDIEICRISDPDTGGVVWLESDNLIDKFPEKDITLGIKNNCSVVYNLTLILERP